MRTGFDTGPARVIPGQQALELDQKGALGGIAEEGEEDPGVGDEIAELEAELGQVTRDGRQILQLDLAQHTGHSGNNTYERGGGKNRKICTRKKEERG